MPEGDGDHEGAPFLLNLWTFTPHAPATPAPRDRHRFRDLTAPRDSSFNEADMLDAAFASKAAVLHLVAMPADPARYLPGAEVVTIRLDEARLVAAYERVAELDPFEFVRTIAVARMLMPASMVRLSAGRETMSDELQALCFSAGANSIFHGEKLLTTPNPDVDHDQALFARLGLRAMHVAVDADGCGAPTCAPLATVPLTGSATDLSVSGGRVFAAKTLGNGNYALTALTVPAS